MEDKIYLTKNLNKTIFVLIIPVIIELLLETMIGYVNVSMLGRHGKNYLAAAEIANNLINTCLILANAFSLGGTVIITKYIGAEKSDKRNQAIAQTISIGLIFSLLFTLIYYLFSTNFLILMGAKDTSEATILSYSKVYISVMTFSIPVLMFRQMFVGILRGMGKTKVPMYLSALNIVLNIIFNFVLIYDKVSIFHIDINTLGLMIKGAALATFFSRSICLGLLILYFIKVSKFNIKLADFVFKKDIILGIFSVGIPTALEMMIFRGGMLYYLSMVTSLGPTETAAHSVANAAESISYTPGSAFNVVIVTLVGQFLGAKNYEMAKFCIKKIDRFAMIFMGSMGLCFFVFPQLFVGIFTDEPEVIELSSKVLRIEALAQISFARYNVYSGLMRTIGKSKHIFIVTTSGVWLIRIVTTFVLIKYTSLGLIGAWIAMCVDIIYRSLLITLLANIFTKKIFQLSKKRSFFHKLKISFFDR